MAAKAPSQNSLPDPYADDPVLFTITAANIEQFSDRLSEGQKALLQKHPESWRMNVNPTRRSASYPEFVYTAFQSNAERSLLDISGDGGVTDSIIGSPFPLPSRGVEVVWNHNLRWRGIAVDRFECQSARTRGTGNFTLVVFEEKIVFPYGAPNRKRAYADELPYVSIAVQSKVIAPAKSSGRGQLILESSNYNLMTPKTWQYNPSLRRVFRTPFSGFDNPAPLTEGLRFNDEADMFNGSPALFDWKLLGKRKLFVPYNAYPLHDSKLSANDILEEEHINPDLTRYELHRVWVVEGTLRSDGPGVNGRPRSRHSYSRRVLYVDEDSWSVVVADNYGKEGGAVALLRGPSHQLLLGTGAVVHTANQLRFQA